MFMLPMVGCGYFLESPILRHLPYLPVYNAHPCIIRTLILTTSFYKKGRIHNEDHL